MSTVIRNRGDEEKIGYNNLTQTGLWFQPDGTNTQDHYLGCDNFGDSAAPKGSKTLLWCRDPDAPGGRRLANAIVEAPGVVTFQIETYFQKAASLLEENLECEGHFYVLFTKCGKPTVWGSWERALIYQYSRNVNEGILNPVSGGAENAIVRQTFDYEANPPMYRVWRPTLHHHQFTTVDANGIVACPSFRCADNCGDARAACETLYATLDADTGLTADVQVSTDNGVNWAATGTDPFDADEDIAGQVCLEKDSDTFRIIVARATTDAGNPAEVAYSDDAGTTWTTVDMPGPNGGYAAGPHALFALDWQHLWFVTTGGYIFFSDDGGESWVAQESADETTEDLHAVWFAGPHYGVAVGTTDAVLYTINGGETWESGTATGGGNTLLDVHVIDYQRVWATDDGGSVYYSTDFTTTWTERTGWTGTGTGEVRAIDFWNEFVGVFAHDDETPEGTIFYTFDGGYHWEALDTPSNDGINDLWMCSMYEVHSVGPAEPQE